MYIHTIYFTCSNLSLNFGRVSKNTVLWSWKSAGRWWQGIVIQSSNFLCQLSLSFFWVSWGTQWCALWGSLLSPACLAYALLCYPSKLLAILIHVLLIPRPFDSARQFRDIPMSILFLFLLFNCKVCDYRYSQKSNLKEHVSSVHDGNKPFKCEVCEHKYFRKSDLKNMWHLFKKEISNSNLRSVTTVFSKEGLE